MMNSHTTSQPRFVAGALAAIVLSTASIADARISKAGAATAAFKASGPAGMSIDGSTGSVSVGDDGTTVSVVVSLASLSTGIALRDKHMKEALEVDRYPTAELRVARSQLRVPAAGAESSGDARGRLTLHGQTKDVPFHYVAKRDGDRIDVQGTARINMNDFGMKTPRYLGVSVKPDVEVSTRFAAKDD